ncbi:MAG: TonB-dependent receptor plug domain-containing protein [Sphingobium sp.]|nr:TonB-dependent receptor plug domain-containing protein [Sphingobium sp.]
MKYFFLLTGMWATAATAQEVQLPADEIVVTGTRSAGRAALSSSAPVDVVDAAALESTGYPDLSRALNFLQPSINFARAATTASAANTRPITLRGLSPDQTLVLVNGKRRHANAVLNVNNSIGRGSAGVDLDTIPDTAIARIEVLRDGAAALYGSDAIAGVVNIILKSNDQGGYGEILGGSTEEGEWAREREHRAPACRGPRHALSGRAASGADQSRVCRPALRQSHLPHRRSQDVTRQRHHRRGCADRQVSSEALGPRSGHTLKLMRRG